VFCLAVLAAAPALLADGNRAVAVVAGASVSQEELDRALGSKLLRVQTDEYNIRRAALDEIIADRLLAAEAARRHVTVDDLLKAEVEAKVTVPSLADIEPFYEATKERFGTAPKEEAMQQIAEGMRRQKTAQRKAELVRSLRDAAGVRVLIEPPRAKVTASGPSLGNSAAPVTIVEFSDFECPFCSRAASTLHRIEQTYGDRVRVVYRDFPLASHRMASRAAEAAHCADEQGKFWEMHDRLFAKGGALTEADLHKFAADAGVDGPKFEACVQSGKYTAAWKASQEDGMNVGVSSTPTFFINGRMVAGAAPFEAFAKLIDEELEHAGAKPPAPLVASRSN
jgi:protein-disulfide isomerase